MMMKRFSVDDKSDWKRTMMIMQPDFIPPEMIDKAVEDVVRKKKLAALREVLNVPVNESSRRIMTGCTAHWGRT